MYFLSSTGVLSDKKTITNSELKMFETTQNIMENTSSSELLVVGPGHLGARVATLWKSRFVSLIICPQHLFTNSRNFSYFLLKQDRILLLISKNVSIYKYLFSQE